MAREKQFVFSARTTEQGLQMLGEVKAKLGVGWYELVVEAVSTHCELDKAMMTVPKKEKPAKEAQPTNQPPAEETTSDQPAAMEQESPAEEKRPAKKQKKGSKKATSAKVNG